MADAVRQILATSGGMRSTGTGPYRWRPSPLLEYALSLSGKPRPKLCFLTTATGDGHSEIAAVYAAFSGRTDVVVSNLELFAMPNVADPRAHLLGQDVIWVGGGSVANLLAVWRVHGLDEAFREAWLQGVVLGGVSAGSICWHAGGTTDSFGVNLRAVTNGLGLVPYSNGVHYDSEERRRPTFHALIADGTLPAGYATDDGVGLHYVGTELHEAVSDVDGASAYHVERTADGSVNETVVPTRRLPG